jgi:ApbE superfamily uncharacterized protein (UPF0280 family)
MSRATSLIMDDGRRHFQHGPIDIVAHAEGDCEAVTAAHHAASERFATILSELVGELPVLRQPVNTLSACPLTGPIAQTMWHACQRCASDFITPMAAVAGSVAQALIGFYAQPGVTRAWVNNGGDIALHLTPGTKVDIGLFADIAKLDGHALREGITIDGTLSIDYTMPVRGVATSGWRGRSLSLGIADSVTVLAETAALADAAATVIANAVNTNHPAVERQPANEVKDNSDLGLRLVTVHVPALDHDTIRQALKQGLQQALQMKQSGLISACILTCQGWVVTTDSPELVRHLIH